MPLGIDGENIKIATCVPFDFAFMADLFWLFGRIIKPIYARRSDLRAQGQRIYGEKGLLEIVDKFKQTNPKRSFEQSEKVGQEPVALLSEELLEDAILRGASDLRIDVLKKRGRVKMRVNGFFTNEQNYDKDLINRVISRIMVMSRMNIAERRAPQDGSFTRGTINIRVAALPSKFGYSLALRFLTPFKKLTGLEELGYQTEAVQKINRMLKADHGLIIIAGPTGSGKSTTLATIVSEAAKKEKSIVTIEDPVEYIIEGVTHTSVDEKGGYDFINALGSVFRQDADAVLVGEIRDSKTAELTMRLASGGRLTFSTLHTNDCLGAFTRLIDFGIPDYLLLETVNGVISQRLIGKLCLLCKIEIESGIFAPKGCHLCNKTGYSGRLAVYDILEITPEIRLEAKKNAYEIRQILALLAKIQVGVKPCAEAALKRGETSLEEVRRVSYWA